MGTNPFMSIAQQAGVAGSDEQSSGNPFLSIAASNHSDEETPSAVPANPFMSIAQGNADSTPSGAAAPQTTSDSNDPNEGMIGKAWDWLNKPLLNLRRQNAGGVEAGVEDVASGLTSPLSIGLTIATAGAGGLLESLGLDLTKMAAPEVISAAKTAGKLAAAGFTAQQLYGIAQESPFFVQAVKDGDTQKALEIGTSSLLQGGMALFGAKHAIGDLLSSPESMQASPVSSMIGRYQRLLKTDTEQASKFNTEFKNAVKVPQQREAIQFYAEAGGDIGKLGDWQKQVEDAKDLDPKLQRQLVDVLKRSQGLSDTATPKEMEWVGRLRELYAGNFSRATNAGILSTESRKTNYVARAPWKQETTEADNVDDAKNALAGSGQMNHTKQRVFESTIEGILSRDKDDKLLGFTPRTNKDGRYMLDAADLASDYHRSIGREVAKKDFVDQALKLRMSDSRPAAVPSGMATEFQTKPVLDEDGNEIAPSETKVSINGDIIPDRPLSKRDVAYLRKQGLFQAMIDNGLIKDQGDRAVETAPAQSAEATEAAKVQEEAKTANPLGELRKDADGKQTLWLGNDGMQLVHRALGGDADSILYGNSLSKDDVQFAIKSLDDRLNSGEATPDEQNNIPHVVDLLKQADNAAGKEGVVVAGSKGRSIGSMVDMLREEYNHRWQKIFSEDGEARTHLTPKQFREVYRLIPESAHAYLDRNGYEAGPVRTIEAAAKLLAGHGDEMGVSDEDAEKFLQKYLDAVVETHGEGALDSLKHVVGVAKRIKEERISNAGVPDGRAVEGSSGGTQDGGNGPVGSNQEKQGSTLQGDDGRTYVETEHTPGQELPITPKPEEDIQAKLQKLPEHIYGAVKALERQAQELKYNPTADSADELREDLLNNRYELEDMFEGNKFPKGVRKAALDYIRQLAPTDDEQLEAKYYKGRYRYNTEGYDNSIRHPYARKSVYGGAEDHFLSAPVAWHPEIQKAAKSILAPEKSFLERNAVTKRVMDISNVAKQTLLSFSGFHWVQEGLKGLESGLGPKTIFNPEGWDMNNVRHIKLIEAGGIQPGIEGGANAFAEGLKGEGLQSHIPGIGPMLDTVNGKLFGPNGYIDRLKLNAALKFDDRLQKMYPKLDETTRLKVAGQLANNRFGGQNYLALGRSPMVRDIMRLTLLAPDWFESQAKDAGMLAGPFAKLRGQDLGRIALYNFVVAQTLNKLNTGRFHLDTPFGVQSQDGKKVYTVRTMPSDLFHAVTNFRDYISNRMNPIVTRTGVEALTGRDKQGKLRDMGEQVKDLFSNVIPIPAHSAFDILSGNATPNESMSDSVRSALGMTTKTNPTPAESLAYKLASENQATGHVPSEQVAKFHSILNLENRLRDGDQSAVRDLQEQYRSGKLARSDVQSILKGARTTRLDSIVNRLPMSNAIDVWNLTTNEERQRLAPVMLKKMLNFQKTERQKLTPAEQGAIDTRLAQVMNELQQARESTGPITPEEHNNGVTAVGPGGHTIVVRGGQWVDPSTGLQVK